MTLISTEGSISFVHPQQFADSVSAVARATENMLQCAYHVAAVSGMRVVVDIPVTCCFFGNTANHAGQERPLPLFASCQGRSRHSFSNMASGWWGLFQVRPLRRKTYWYSPLPNESSSFLVYLYVYIYDVAQNMIRNDPFHKVKSCISSRTSFTSP